MSREWKSRDDKSSGKGKSDRSASKGRSFSSNDRTERNSRGSSASRNASERQVDNRRENAGDRSFNQESKPYGKQDNRSGDRKPYSDRSSSSDRKPYGDRPSGGDRSRSFGDKPAFGDRKPYEKRPSGGDRSRSFGDKPAFGDRKPYGDRPSGDDRSRSFGDKPAFGDRKPYGNRPSGGDRSRSFGDKPAFGDRKPYGDRPSGGGDRSRSFGDKPAFRDRKPYGDRPSGDDRSRSFGDKPAFGDRKPYGDRPSGGGDRKKTFKPRSNDGVRTFDRPYRERSAPKPERQHEANDGLLRLNRYIANAGVCSRRKADELIELGEIQVNGIVITELGHKISPTDTVHFNGQLLRRERMTYVLLNKPKDYITTTDDPRERRTVMELVEKASKERIYPVGRLDRNTTGLLLLTNDGDLAEKLSHPKHKIEKLYYVTLNKNIRTEDLEQIKEGIELEDGFVKPDEVAFVDGASKKDIGIKIHSGKNRIVRRIFEHMGYEVMKLDRVMYAGLTKKDIPRGKWKYLDEKELMFLKRLVK
ncbi:pseudouridine synthase [Solitalea koreensis]|nr:pseudouridine synthase [Solitalea koreensis]